MPCNRSYKRGAVLRNLRILSLGKRHFLAAPGRDLLVQHRAAGFPLSGKDQAANFLPLFYIIDQIQRRIVHLVELIHFQNPFHFSGKVFYNIAILPVKSRFSPGNQVQVKIFSLLPGEPVRDPGVYAIENPFVSKRLIEGLPGEFRAFSCRGKHHHPGIELIHRKEKAGQSIQRRQFILPLLFLLLLGTLSPAFLVHLFQSGSAGAGEKCFQSFVFLLHHIRRERSILIQTNPRRRQIARFLSPQVKKRIKRVFGGQLQR